MEQHHAEDVGRILLDVHDQLKALRASIDSTDGTGGGVPGIHAIIAQAERDLQAKAELVLSSVVQSTTVSLPVVPGHRGPRWCGRGRGCRVGTTSRAGWAEAATTTLWAAAAWAHGGRAPCCRRRSGRSRW